MTGFILAPTTLEQLEVQAERAGYSTDDYLIQLLAPQPAHDFIPADHQHVFEMISDAVMICGMDEHFVFCNRPALDRLGYTLDEMRAMTPAEVIHPDFLTVSRSYYRRLWAGETILAEMAHVTKQGRVIPVEFHAQRSTYNQQPVIVSIVRDISERQMIEKNLRRGEDRLRHLIETQSAYVIRTDIYGNYSYINPAFFKRFCYANTQPDELIGQSSLSHIYPDDHPKTFDTVMACIADLNVPKQIILRKLNPDGSFFSTLWEFVALTNEAGEFHEMQCIGVDITELLHIRQRMELQENALNAAANAIVIVDKSGAIEWVNPAFTTFTGYTLDEVRGQNPRVLKSGLQDDSFYADMWNTVLSGSVWRGKLINQRKDGSLYTEEQTITPVRDVAGNVTHFVAIKQDVTEREEAEKIRQEQERLKSSLKDAEEYTDLVRKVVSALSHDVRTPLAVIDAARETLDAYYDRLDEDKRHEKLDVISKQVRFVLEMLNDATLTVKNGGSYSDFKRTHVNLPALCQLSISEIQQTFGTGHSLSFVTDGRIHTAFVDETLVSRILHNLLSNAVKFSPQGGRVTLKLCQQDTDIVLKVTDEGMGISEADLPHIFEPFYRSGAAKTISGTGLGLNIVKDCVDRHAGQISVESRLGHGTTFTVTLPVR